MENKKEIIWKNVKGFEGIYRINSKGEIWRCRMVACDKYELIKKLGKKGQRLVGLAKDGTVQMHQRHTLIYDHFNENRKGSIQFKDGNKSNLSIDNMITKGLSRGGSNRHLNKELHSDVLSFVDNNVSHKEIAKNLKCSIQTVRNIVLTDRVSKALESGISKRGLSRKLKVKQSVIVKILKRLGE